MVRSPNCGITLRPLFVGGIPARDSGPRRVADRCCGVPEQDLVRIFEKSFRSPEQRYAVPSTGMGLAIAKRILEAHGGKIWVTSAPTQRIVPRAPGRLRSAHPDPLGAR